ncbi:MAG: class I SAM-dependent methyltransferase [Acidobacteria bacterium]|nr:class I SAM-dependent methyltransferase [Acidobacteriota bacterium]MBK8148809.1 class I SAM-dependent methyltransferase [Acidobacteriota bacterium]MBK8810144.1 class I SAM-dependent methyltransferase [Acidobacteriota bacterium]
MAKSKTENFYDRIADVHNLAMKLNGYTRSVAKYLRSLELEIDENSRVLDAGSGTGIVTSGFYGAGLKPKQTVAFDLSFNLLSVSRDQFRKDKRTKGKDISPVRGNVLAMPFADNTFDLLLSCGVLEYVPLDEGLREFARVMKPGAKLVFIPVKPSLVGSVLELLYKFKTHPPDEVRDVSERYFNFVGNHDFPFTDPIGWSKTIFLLEKR